MASLQVGDPGLMAAVSAPLSEVEAVLAEVDGYVVIANVNSTNQVVLGGATAGVTEAIARLAERGHEAMTLPVSHAFHTEIVAAVADPLRDVLRKLTVLPAQIPVVANVDGRLLSDRARSRRGDPRDPRAPGGVAGAVRHRAAHAVRRRSSRVRRDGAQARAVGLRERCARRRRC